MPNTDKPDIIAVMCMAYDRYPGSLKTIDSLTEQVDALYLCLSDFPQIPPELQREKVEIMHSGTGLADVDVMCLQLLKDRGPPAAHVLVCDDGLVYPPAYAEDFLIAHKEHPDAILTHHGFDVFFPEEGQFLYSKIAGFQRREPGGIPLNVPGSGVSFIPKSVFGSLAFHLRSGLNQTHIHLACHGLKLNIPIISMPHQKLQPLSDMPHQRSTFKIIDSNRPSSWFTAPVNPAGMHEIYAVYQSYGVSHPYALPPSMLSDLSEPFDADTPPRIVATMCMLPARYPDSLQTIRSLENQVDTLYLCLNDFWEVPLELKRDKIKILHLGDNLGDAARFYLLRNKGALNAHVLSCDDDLEYPESYVQDYLAAHAQYPEAVLTHHGSIWCYDEAGGLTCRGVVKYDTENPEARKLDIPGSNISFIPRSVFNRLEFTSLVSFNDADMHLSANYRKLEVPVIGLSHKKDYAKDIRPPGPTIWLTQSRYRSRRISRAAEIYASYGLRLDRSDPDMKRENDAP